MFLEIQSTDSNLMATIQQKAQPYFERGINAVREGRPLRTFEEAVDIIKLKLLEHGLDEDLAEAFACTFAQSYIAGTVAAAQLVNPAPEEQFEPCLELHYGSV